MNSWFKTIAVLIAAIIFSKVSNSQEKFAIKAGVNLEVGANRVIELSAFYFFGFKAHK